MGSQHGKQGERRVEESRRWEGLRGESSKLTVLQSLREVGNAPRERFRNISEVCNVMLSEIRTACTSFC